MHNTMSSNTDICLIFNENTFTAPEHELISVSSTEQFFLPGCKVLHLKSGTFTPHKKHNYGNKSLILLVNSVFHCI